MKTLAPYKTIQVDIIIEMTLPSIQYLTKSAFYLLVCEDQRRSNNVAMAIRSEMSHGVNKINMNIPTRILSIVVMVLLVVAMVIRRRDNILW
jgi:hypothetical protein